MKNVKASLYRDQENEEWKELNSYKFTLQQLPQAGSSLEDKSHEIKKIMCLFSNFKLCTHCGWVFKKDGLLQHENKCKLGLKLKLDSECVSETPDSIYDSNKKLFSSIADTQPKTYEMLRKCVNENDYVKAYLDVRDSFFCKFLDFSFELRNFM